MLNNKLSWNIDVINYNYVGRICNTCKIFPTIEVEKLYNNIVCVNFSDDDFIEKTCKETSKYEKDSLTLLLEDILEKLCNEK